jgi:hypothetical protein
MLALIALGACAGGERSGDTASREDSAGASAVGVPPSVRADSATDATSNAWTIRPDGVRSVRIGMTAGEVRTALALPATAGAATPEACAYLEAPSLPVKLYFMTVTDTLVRIDVRDSTVATSEGARVGDSEARINELYTGRVTSQPHKYTGPMGHYLVVTAPGDTTHLIVFETDGQRVTNYRVGRKPEVQWVEGCS